MSSEMVEHEFGQKLHKALRLCVKAHRGQNRDGDHPLPYATHPVDVLGKLRHIGKVTDEDMLCAALLHDLLEETGVTAEEIKRKIGARVSALVVELTREEPDPATRTRYSEQAWYDLRNKLLIEEIEKMGPDAQQVKLSDRLSNLESALATRSGLKLERYVRQSEQILQVVPRQRNPMLWDGIKELIDRYETNVDSKTR